MNVRVQLNTYLASDANVLGLALVRFTPGDMEMSYLEDTARCSVLVSPTDSTLLLKCADQPQIAETLSQRKYSLRQLPALLDAFASMVLEKEASSSSDPLSPKRTSFDEGGNLLTPTPFFSEDGMEEVFVTPTVSQAEALQRKMLDDLQAKQFEQVKRNLQVGDLIKDMSANAGDWKSEKAEGEIFINFYADGFEVDRDGALRSLEDPKNKRQFEQLQKGTVPNELNPRGFSSIDLHVLWHDCKFADRKPDAAPFGGDGFPQLGLGDEPFVSDPSVEPDVGSHTDPFYCGVCTVINDGTAKACKVCGTARQAFGDDLPLDAVCWSCPSCVCANGKERVYCGVCGSESKGGKQQPKKLWLKEAGLDILKFSPIQGKKKSITIPPQESKKTVFETKPAVKPKFFCGACTASNREGTEKCHVCDTPRQAFDSELKDTDMCWECRECKCLNMQDRGYCGKCNLARQEGQLVAKKKKFVAPEKPSGGILSNFFGLGGKKKTEPVVPAPPQKAHVEKPLVDVEKKRLEDERIHEMEAKKLENQKKKVEEAQKLVEQEAAKKRKEEEEKLRHAAEEKKRQEEEEERGLEEKKRKLLESQKKPFSYAHDPSKPSTKLRIRFPTGSEVMCVNCDALVDVLFGYVGSKIAVPFTLSIPYPKKVIENNGKTVAESGLNDQQIIVVPL